MTNASLHTIAFLFTVLILLLGCSFLSFWTALVFTSGFIIGFLLYILTPSRPKFKQFRTPYWLVLGLFTIHRIEEQVTGFHARLSDLTEVSISEFDSPQTFFLVLLSVGGWLAIPALVRRRDPLGHYLAWTFFSTMGITELTHFCHPLLTHEPYEYFPGLGSVIVLVPAAWWGMHRLSNPSIGPQKSLR